MATQCATKTAPSISTVERISRVVGAASEVDSCGRGALSASELVSRMCVKIQTSRATTAPVMPDRRKVKGDPKKGRKRNAINATPKALPGKTASQMRAIFFSAFSGRRRATPTPAKGRLIPARNDGGRISRATTLQRRLSKAKSDSNLGVTKSSAQSVIATNRSWK